MDESATSLRTAGDCGQVATNTLGCDLPDLANQAHKRAVELRAEAYGAQTQMERECFEAVCAYEDVLAAKKHHRVHVSTIWQTIDRHGVVLAVERAVIRGAEIPYAAALQKMGLQDHAFEAVVVRHPEFFSAQTVLRATRRVNEWKPCKKKGMIKKRMQRLFYQAMNREKRHILSEFVQVKGLMPLLMKPRKKQQWSTQDKRELKLHLKSLSRMSAYVAVVVMPGGLAMLPVMAWWRNRRRDPCAAPETK